jgi:two-component system, LytTR family, sensor kinase
MSPIADVSRDSGFPLSRRSLAAIWAAGWAAILAIVIGDIWMQYVIADASFFEPWYQLPRAAAPVLIGAGLSVGVFLAFRPLIGSERSLPSRLAHYVPIGLAYWITLSALAASLDVLIWPGPPVTFLGALAQTLPGWAFNSLLLFAVMAILYEAILNVEMVSEEETRAARYAAELSRARTAALSAQLDPHFLFNTLHVVSGLMHPDVEAAQEVLADLRALLAESFRREGQRMVRLTDELRLVERYLRIQQARFGERLDVHFDVDPAAASTLVPPLLLQPLVENAIQHGIARQTEGGLIRIQIQRRPGQVSMIVENSGVSGDTPERSAISERIGLGGVRARLSTVFGDAARIVVDHRDSGGFRAVVTVPEITRVPEARQESDLPVQKSPEGASGQRLPGSRMPDDGSPMLRLRPWGRGRWLLVGGLAWLGIAMHYHLVLGFRRTIQGQPFYSSWQQLAPNSLMFLIGAVLTPVIVMALWKLRSPDRGPPFVIGAYVGMGIVFWVAWASIALFLLPLLLGPTLAFSSFAQALVMSAFVALLLYTGMALIVEANWQLHVARRRAMEAAVLRADLHAAETSALRSKVDPRLLFDSLSVVSEVMGSDVRAARNILSDLSELLRASLGRDGRSLVSLDEELEHVRRVLNIHIGRGAGPDLIRVELDDDVSHRLVPHLVLQPLAAEIARCGTQEGGRSIEVVIRGEHAGEDRIRLAIQLECKMNGRERLPVRMDADVLDHMQAWLGIALGVDAGLAAAESADGTYTLEFRSIGAVDSSPAASIGGLGHHGP